MSQGSDSKQRAHPKVCRVCEWCQGGPGRGRGKGTSRGCETEDSAPPRPWVKRELDREQAPAGPVASEPGHLENHSEVGQGQEAWRRTETPPSPPPPPSHLLLVPPLGQPAQKRGAHGSQGTVSVGSVSLTQSGAETENSSRAGRGEKPQKEPLEPKEIHTEHTPTVALVFDGSGWQAWGSRGERRA